MVDAPPRADRNAGKYQPVTRMPSIQRPDRPKISIVSPCFNEEANIRTCYETVRRIFEHDCGPCEREHIFADNCSTDRTVEILRDIAKDDASVKVVVNSRNFGLFRSTFNALRYATGDAIVVMLPVDLQDPPELIADFIRLWQQGYDVVAGVRASRRESLPMRAARRIFYSLVQRLSGFDIPENVGEFQLIDRSVLNAVLKFDDHYPYIRGIIAACGFKRVLVPYTWARRERGFSKIRLWESIDHAINGILSFTNVPMRLCTLGGVAIAASCVLYALFSLLIYVISPDVAPRGTTSLVIGMFFLFSIQLIFIGLLGEYITSIHFQVRKGPLVVERELINIDSR
jgi:glycosyltransferase involved in cell wall biosynthesis